MVGVDLHHLPDGGAKLFQEPGHVGVDIADLPVYAGAVPGVARNRFGLLRDTLGGMDGHLPAHED
ncbi:MAG: hypothetical protein ACE5JL_14940 [Dehalococcoidia bacterium]